MTERTTIGPLPPPAVDVGDTAATPVAAVQLMDDGAPVGAMVRVLAYVFDALVIALLIYLVALILRALIGPTLRITEVDGVPRVRVDRLRSIVDAVSATTVTGVYFLVSWLRFGATPAQRLIGARVERADGGGRLSPGQALGRWLLLGAPFGLVSTILVPEPLLGAVLAFAIFVWYAVLFLTTARDRRKRGLHDRVAGSIVLRRGRGAGGGGSVDGPVAGR